MNIKGKISIIIAMYNMEQYIAACLDSIFDEAMENIEVIVVDDGSTDHSKDVIEHYLSEHDNLKVLKQKNKGQAVARNNALAYATGEYVTYIDADDYFEKGGLRKAYEKIQQNKPDILVTEYRKVFNDKIQGNDQVHNISVDFNKSYQGYEVAEMMLKEQVQGFACTKFFKKELLLTIDFYQEPGRYIEDLVPVFKAVSHGTHIMFLEGVVYNYCQRASSSVNERNIKLMNDYLHAAKQVIKHASKNDKINKKTIETFQTIAYLSLVNYYTQANIHMGKKVYQKFKQINQKEIPTPNLMKSLVSQQLTIKRKLSLVLWKLGGYHWVMKLRMKQKYN